MRYPSVEESRRGWQVNTSHNRRGNGIEAKAGVLEKRFEKVRTFSQPIKFVRYSFTRTADQSVNQALEGQDEARCCSVRV